MKTNNLVGMILTVAVGVVCIGAVLMPTLSAVTETEDTVTNDGLYRMSEYQSADTFSAVWEYATPYQFTVNGEVVAIPSTAGMFDYTIMGNDEFSVRFFFDTGLTRLVQVFTGTESTNVYYARNTGVNASDMEITLAEGVLTFDNGSGTTASVTLTDSFYCIANDGEFVMKMYNETAYVVEDSKIVAIGFSTVNTSESTTSGERFFIEGNIEDGFTAVGIPLSLTIGSISATYTESANTDFVDLYDFSKLTFTVTYNETDTDLTYSQILVPYEVTAETSDHLSATEIGLIMVIPILVIIGVLMVAVRGITRND